MAEEEIRFNRVNLRERGLTVANQLRYRIDFINQEDIQPVEEAYDVLQAGLKDPNNIVVIEDGSHASVFVMQEINRVLHVLEIKRSFSAGENSEYHIIDPEIVYQSPQGNERFGSIVIRNKALA